MFAARGRCALALALALASGCTDPADRCIVDAGPPPDASTIDAAVGVVCGDAFCELDSHCCSDQLNPPRVSNFCVVDGFEVCMGAIYHCDGPEDCGDGEVCCSNDGVACAPAAECEGFVICHNTAHCPAPLFCTDTPRGIIRACL